jgi:hypothetical protein
MVDIFYNALKIYFGNKHFTLNEYYVFYNKFCEEHIADYIKYNTINYINALIKLRNGDHQPVFRKSSESKALLLAAHSLRGESWERSVLIRETDFLMKNGKEEVKSFQPFQISNVEFKVLIKGLSKFSEKFIGYFLDIISTEAVLKKIHESKSNVSYPTKLVDTIKKMWKNGDDDYVQIWSRMIESPYPIHPEQLIYNSKLGLLKSPNPPKDGSKSIIDIARDNIDNY